MSGVLGRQWKRWLAVALMVVTSRGGCAPAIKLGRQLEVGRGKPGGVWMKKTGDPLFSRMKRGGGSVADGDSSPVIVKVVWKREKRSEEGCSFGGFNGGSSTLGASYSKAGQSRIVESPHLFSGAQRLSPLWVPRQCAGGKSPRRRLPDLQTQETSMRRCQVGAVRVDGSTEAGMAFILWHCRMRAKSGSLLIKHLAINLGCEFLRRNSGGPIYAVNIPHASMLEVGMIYNI